MINKYYELLKKDYKFKIINPFLNAIKDYLLINDNDKIAVCISGGKDSFVMAMCFKLLEENPNYHFKTEYILMNPGYKEEDLESIKLNAKQLDIDIKVFDTEIFKIAEKNEDKRCYLCAKMRRGALYNIANSLGCNKIALGHHMDDVNETLLLSILYSGEIGGMRPIVNSTSHENMSLIRPMYYIKEKDIIDYSKNANINFLKCGCFLKDNKSLCENSKRQIVKKLIKDLDDSNETVSKNIFKSYDNVNLNKLNSYKLDDDNINLLKK